MARIDRSSTWRADLVRATVDSLETTLEGRFRFLSLFGRQVYAKASGNWTGGWSFADNSPGFQSRGWGLGWKSSAERAALYRLAVRRGRNHPRLVSASMHRRERQREMLGRGTANAHDPGLKSRGYDQKPNCRLVLALEIAHFGRGWGEGGILVTASPSPGPLPEGEGIDRALRGSRL